MKASQKIKELRWENGHKQSVVANALSISQPEYSKLENGKRKKLDIEVIKKLCEFYKIDIQEFVQ